ncbi:hypothetical protein RI129_008055 [Pyrocoelia pectoralis]|uniref:Protein arginine N-methyltransferase domain-containing protein n=1 Tax=Pyrocoelia pectoralis TaxID=417401 RepID=A0AAN7ZFG4_9COLE
MYNANEKRKVGLTCLLKARNYAKLKNWARSFPHYLMCLELFENDRNSFECEFAEVLYQLGIWLESNNRLTDVCKWYIKGLEYYSSNANILNHFAEHLLRIEEPQLALTYLETAHELNPSSLLIDRNLTAAKLNIIPRWHYRMLNDRKRNEAFKAAISKVISQEHSKVLDIGTGCGLLSFYASQYTNMITAVESSNAFCKIAKLSLPEITVINKHSTSLQASNIGLHNVLVTEIFDAALFGEHALETIIHAYDNLLESPSEIVPHSADLFVTGFSGSDLLRRHKLKPDPRLCLNNVCVTQRVKEPYEADNLKLRPVTYITNTYKACTVFFNDVSQLRNIYNNVDAIPSFSLLCVNNGIIDGFAIWFNLYLDEGRANVITTDPREDNVTCWEQAIIYLDHPIIVQKDDEVTLKLSCICNELKLVVLQPETVCSRCFKVSSDIISYLNDANIIDLCESFQLPNEFGGSKVFDLNPFPLFALFLAKSKRNMRFKCLVKDLQDFEFINYVCESNGVDSFEVCQEAEFQDTDLIFINPLARNGTLEECVFHQLPLIRNRLFPKGLYLHIEVIESDYLEHCCKIDDRNLLGHTVAYEMNKYSVNEHWEVEPQYFSYKSIGCANVDMDLLHNDICTNISVSVLEGCTANGVLYWFTMDYLTHRFATFNSLYYNNACFIFSQPRYLNEDVLSLTVRKEGGLLHIGYTYTDI